MDLIDRSLEPVRSRVSSSIRFDRDGKHRGFLSIPHSSHVSAYGRIQIPVVSIRNGEGPTALLVAGNHGDEYEGQVALTELAQSLQPHDLKGGVLILPVLNAPAAQAARRSSPIDDGNLNRSFPGDPDGAPTEMLAHYVESVLLPLADYSVDLHSGGTSLCYQPCTLIRDTGSPKLVARQFAALKAFGGEFAYVTSGENQGAEQTFAAAAHRCGVVCITTELGGGASISCEGAALARAGVARILHHAGILKAAPPASTTQLKLMTVENGDSYLLAPEAGVFEPAVALGATIARGDLAGHLWFPDTPWRKAEELRFVNGGHVICKRSLAWTRRGDCLVQVLAPYEKQLRP